MVNEAAPSSAPQSQNGRTDELQITSLPLPHCSQANSFAQPSPTSGMLTLQLYLVILKEAKITRCGFYPELTEAETPGSLSSLSRNSPDYLFPWQTSSSSIMFATADVGEAEGFNRPDQVDVSPSTHLLQ